MEHDSTPSTSSKAQLWTSSQPPRSIFISMRHFALTPFRAPAKATSHQQLVKLPEWLDLCELIRVHNSTGRLDLHIWNQVTLSWVVFGEARHSIYPWKSVGPYPIRRHVLLSMRSSLASRPSPEGSRHLNSWCVLASPLHLAKLALVGMNLSSTQTSLLTLSPFSTRHFSSPLPL